MIPEPDAPWINVFIDSNVWNFLFERQIDLAVDLPPDKFCLCHTREVELENEAIPPEKAELKAFIDGDIPQPQSHSNASARTACGMSSSFICIIAEAPSAQNARPKGCAHNPSIKRTVVLLGQSSAFACQSATSSVERRHALWPQDARHALMADLASRMALSGLPWAVTTTSPAST